MNIGELQTQHRMWLNHNFPDQPPHSPLLGIVEEVGELAHAHLKREQGIRRNENHDEGVIDALGDLFIYMLSYCNTNFIDLEHVVMTTWRQVAQRDWIAFPNTGLPHE